MSEIRRGRETERWVGEVGKVRVYKTQRESHKETERLIQGDRKTDRETQRNTKDTNRHTQSRRGRGRDRHAYKEMEMWTEREAQIVWQTGR